jgi:hypothetical protein
MRELMANPRSYLTAAMLGGRSLDIRILQPVAAITLRMAGLRYCTIDTGASRANYTDV